MPPKGLVSVINVHPDAVVGHPNHRFAAVDEIDVDPRGAGIERVFNQFLHDRGWAFNHFARRDLIHGMQVEQSNRGHARQFTGLTSHWLEPDRKRSRQTNVGSDCTLRRHKWLTVKKAGIASSASFL